MTYLLPKRAIANARHMLRAEVPGVDGKDLDVQEPLAN